MYVVNGITNVIVFSVIKPIAVEELWNDDSVVEDYAGSVRAGF